jgi:7-keto-8-aminopelargonate synthetase-like enzyme
MENRIQPLVMETAPGPEVVINGESYLYFGGTSYYCLHQHPALIEAGINAWKSLGTNTATSRRGPGTTTAHLEVERCAANFFGVQDSAYTPSGYLNNTAGVQALSQSKAFDVIFIDEHAHFCLRDAANSVAANTHTFRHLDPDDLRHQLVEHVGPRQTPLILTDGVFPGPGKIVPLDVYLDMLEPWNGLIWLDDAHSAGVLGDSGRGTADYYKTDCNRVFSGTTLSKAFGGFGGVIHGDEKFISSVRLGPVMSAASPPPTPIAAATAVGIRLLSESPEWRKQLWRNARLVKNGLRDLGLDIDDTEVPIATFTLDGYDYLQHIRQSLLEQHIYVQHASYPGSGHNGLIRIVVFSSHTEAQIEHLSDALSRAL